MATFGKMTGGTGVAVLAGGLLVTALAAPSTASVRVVRIPCGASALSAAITAANAPGGTVIRLAPRCVYDITTPATAGTGLPAITGDVILLGGPGTTIRRSPAAAMPFRIFNVAAAARLVVVGIVILDGSTASLGGAISNAGRLVLNHTTLSGNRASNGGAIANMPGATATVSRSVISLNTAGTVGGGGVINLGALTMFATRVAYNTAPINGGGVNTQPSATTRLIQSTVDHNTSGSLGGGLSNLGTTTLHRSVVRFNRGSAGGGIATGNSNVLISRSIVRDNVPGNCSPPNTIPGCAG